MNVDYFKKGKAWLFILLFLTVGVTDARAEFQLTDNLLLSGFIRETAVMAIGTPNPDLEALGIDKPRWNLLRTMLQMELNWQPNDIFRFFITNRNWLMSINPYLIGLLIKFLIIELHMGRCLNNGTWTIFRTGNIGCCVIIGYGYKTILGGFF